MIFSTHVRKRMRERHINDPVVLEVLRMGNFALRPEPDMQQPGLLCRING